MRIDRLLIVKGLNLQITISTRDAVSHSKFNDHLEQVNEAVDTTVLDLYARLLPIAEKKR